MLAATCNKGHYHIFRRRLWQAEGLQVPRKRPRKRVRAGRCWQAIVRSPSLAEEVFLVDRVQHCDRRSLDDFVFECGDRGRTLSAVRLRYVNPPAR